jgi:hypothetical protein
MNVIRHYKDFVLQHDVNKIKPFRLVTLGHMSLKVLTQLIKGNFGVRINILLYKRRSEPSQSHKDFLSRYDQ